MKTNFEARYLTKPVVHCTQDGCPLSETCLHSLVHRHLTSRATIECYNPRQQPVGDSCPYYLPQKVIRTARGFRSGLLRVPQGYSQEIRETIQEEMDWARTTYYEYRIGKRGISPDEQKRIKSIFGRYGVKGKIFDSHESVYVTE